MMRPAVTLVLLVACGAHGSPDGVPDARPLDDAGPPRQTIMDTQNLQPGELVEGIMTGDHADTAAIRLTAPMQLDWNIHSHATGHAMTVYEEYGKPSVDYTFVPPGSGDWYLLIRNSGNVTADIQVSVGLYGGMMWRWQ